MAFKRKRKRICNERRSEKSTEQNFIHIATDEEKKIRYKIISRKEKKNIY